MSGRNFNHGCNFVEEASTLNLCISCKIILFAYYERAFHYQQLEKNSSPSDKNSAHGMHFKVNVYRMTKQKWVENND